MAATNIHSYPATGGGAKGIREGLTDIVADLFADDVPLLAASRKVPTTSTKVEWQSDNLAAASKTAVAEGASVSYGQITGRTRHQNYTHIRLRNWDVTFTVLATTIAGIRDEVARQIMKAMKALATDYEKIFQDTGNSGAGATGSGRTAKGLSKAITTNVVSYAGVSTFLDENDITSVLKKIWDNAGNPRVMYCGGQSKRQISETFSARTGFSFNINQTARTMISNINKYEGSFGTVDVVPDRFIRPEKVHIVSPDLIRIAVLRDITQYKGAPTASSVKGWVEAEMSLVWGNEKGHGKVSGVKTSGTVS